MNQPLITLIDQGEVQYFGRKARRISFRGSVPFTDGKDVREWEGYVYLDPITLAPLEIIAVPLNQHEKMTVQLEKYRMSWKIAILVVGFRTRKKPKGQIYRLSFVPAKRCPASSLVARIEISPRFAPSSNASSPTSESLLTGHENTSSMRHVIGCVF